MAPGKWVDLLDSTVARLKQDGSNWPGGAGAPNLVEVLREESGLGLARCKEIVENYLARREPGYVQAPAVLGQEAPAADGRPAPSGRGGLPVTLAGYEELEAYLREYRNGHGAPVPYDVVGVFHLLLALVDNLRGHHIEADLEQFAEGIEPEQLAFLEKLVSFCRRNESRER